MRVFQPGRLVSIAVLVLLALAVARAATHRFQEREDAFRKECAAERQKLGLSPADLRAKYPTPEISLASAACVMPGATADLTVTGKFGAGSRFFIENDNIEVVKETFAPNVYRATIKAGPDIGPQSASIAVVQEVTGRSASIPGVVVGGRYEWTMQSSNGWKIVARSKATTACPAGTSGPEYDVRFYRQGETTPFETMDGRLDFSLFSSRPFTLRVLAAPGADVSGYQALLQKMGDPKLTDAQRQQLVKQIEQAQKQMMAGIEKMRDPAYVKAQAEEQQRKEQQFGCRSLLMAADAGKVSGDLNCSSKLGRLTVTGTLALMK